MLSWHRRARPWLPACPRSIWASRSAGRREQVKLYQHFSMASDIFPKVNMGKELCREFSIALAYNLP